ncbi:unnamed protein product [Mytilus coruscus]|uniref:Uncharacterized protein n=1 Tax=Mytilus coruscus TaxID=42192 RepID=A0A6J8BFV2_MYTCO|nr:unnamed protein product [Mytilus coruscus]
MFILPSGGLLQRYKNFVPQNSGVNIELFRWMLNTAKKMKLPMSGYHGGLVHDETKIQEDLVINTKGCENQLVGWVDTGDEGESLKILKEKTVNKTLATEVLQVSFLGYTDGGQQNREFMKIHFDNDMDAKIKKYCSESLVNPEKKVAHLQDFSHNMKKLRNAVLSSGINKFHTRTLTRNGLTIVWEQCINAAKWDEEKNSRRVHYKLTSSHLHPDSAEKIRNHLAEEVLNEDMLHLMKEYRNSLLNGVVLDSAIEFLEHTSILVSVFRDKRPILSSLTQEFNCLIQC